MTRRFSFFKQILSEDVSCQQILFLSADFVSRFLLSADFVFVSRFCQKIFFVSRFVFVSKCLYTCQQNDARAGTSIFTPACFVRETFSPPAGAHFRCNHDCTRFAGPSWHNAQAVSKPNQVSSTILYYRYGTTGSTIQNPTTDNSIKSDD
jgi:hypothetical protein